MKISGICLEKNPTNQTSSYWGLNKTATKQSPVSCSCCHCPKIPLGWGRKKSMMWGLSVLVVIWEGRDDVVYWIVGCRSQLRLDLCCLIPYKACLFTGFAFTGSWCGAFQWSRAMMETQIRGYFSSKVRHPEGTHQISTSACIKQRIHLCPWEKKIYPLKVFAFSQRRCNPQFLIQFPLCAMGVVVPSTVCRFFIWARWSSSVC